MYGITVWIKYRWQQKILRLQRNGHLQRDWLFENFRVGSVLSQCFVRLVGRVLHIQTLLGKDLVQRPPSRTSGGRARRQTQPFPLRGRTSAAYLSIREERSPQSWADCYYYASWQPSDRRLSKAVGTASPWEIPVFSRPVEPYPLTSREVEPLLVERTRGSTWSSEDPSCTRAAVFRRVVPPSGRHLSCNPQWPVKSSSRKSRAPTRA